KAHAGMQGRDGAREQRVHRRAATLATALGLPPETASGVLALAIGDACRTQGLEPDLDQGATTGNALMIAPTMHTISHSASTPAHSLLRLLPPPRRIAPLLRALPPPAQKRLLERAMAKVLAGPLADGTLDF